MFQSAYFHTGALTLVQGMIALIDCLNELEEEGARAKKEAVAKKATVKKNVASVKNPTTKRAAKRAAT